MHKYLLFINLAFLISRKLNTRNLYKIDTDILGLKSKEFLKLLKTSFCPACRESDQRPDFKHPWICACKSLLQ